MTTLQEQARALGDPTRYEIFRLIADAGRPVGVAELNEHFAFNHNAIRQHLAKLVQAGLVVESKAAVAGPGRRRLVYVVNPATDGRWGTTGPYERLSQLLVEIIATGRGPEEVGRRAADQFRVPSPSGDAVADVTGAMARQGFHPEAQLTRSGPEIILHNCPFAETARLDRRTICSLHLGIAEGLASGTNVVVDELVAYDPRNAGCRLRMRTTQDDAPREPASGKLSLRGRAAKT